MRIQAYSLMSLVSFAGIAAAGFVGACGGKVVVDGANPDGTGGAGGGFSVTSTTTLGVSVSTGVFGTTSSPSSSGATMDVSSSVSTGFGGSSSTGFGGSSSAVSSSTGFGGSSSAVASSAVSSVAASSSTGVVDSCENACDKAQMCGLDFCGQFNINCANPPMQAQCGLDCIANGSCGDIAKLAMQNFATPLGFCLLGCGGMGPGGVGSSGVGSTGSGPPPMACQQCTLQQCGGPIFQCNAKKGAGSCSQWLQCAQGCGQDSMCLFGCDSQFPNAAPQYLPVYDCLCSNCDASCPAQDACGHTGVAPSGAAVSSVGSVGSGGVGGAAP